MPSPKIRLVLTIVYHTSINLYPLFFWKGFVSLGVPKMLIALELACQWKFFLIKMNVKKGQDTHMYTYMFQKVW